MQANPPFTIDEIKQAHAKVKSGADFPAYIRDLILLGVTRYTTYVKDGHTLYYGDNDFKISTEAKYPGKSISDNVDVNTFEQQLRKHQQGKTDYPTFCDDCARNGVVRWDVDLSALTCTYYDGQDRVMLTEAIPV